MTAISAKPFEKNEVLTCVESASKLTLGNTYRVEWNLRPDINFPTVINDDGRPTQYAGRRFQRQSQRPLGAA